MYLIYFYLDLCRSKGIRSYPTLTFHGQDDKKKNVIVNYDGDHHWEDVEEWYHDLKQPSVIKLDAQSFYQRVVGRPDGEVWFVDFAANWCRPCQMMLSDFKHAAKQVAGIHFGYVECTEHQAICDGFNIRTYPTIHLFQPKSPDNIGKLLISNNKLLKLTRSANETVQLSTTRFKCFYPILG